jgi:hypothetical protein
MVSAVGGPTSWSPIERASALAEDSLRLQFENVELDVQGMELFSKRLAETVERSSAHEAERAKQRAELYNLGMGQTLLSAVSATLGVGAALSSGAGAAYATAMVGLSIFNLGHQAVTQAGGYSALAGALGGTQREIEERTQAIQQGMGYMTLGASIAGFCLSDAGQLGEGWKFLTEQSFGGLPRAAATMQALLGMREGRAHGEAYNVQIAWMEDRQQLFVQRLERDGAQQQMQLSLSQVEKVMQQALETIRIRQKITQQEAGL